MPIITIVNEKPTKIPYLDLDRDQVNQYLLNISCIWYGMIGMLLIICILCWTGAIHVTGGWL